MTGATIGKMAIIPNIIPFCLVNQRVGLFYPKHSKLCTPYLYVSCLRSDVQNEITTRGGGSAQPNISGQSIEEIEIPLLIPEIMNVYNSKYQNILDNIRHLLDENAKLNELKQLYLKKFFG